MAFPLLLPQVAAVVEVDNVIAEEVFSVVVAEAVHPPAPVTVTEYVFGAKLMMESDTAPLLQTYEYGPVPAETVTFIFPLLFPQLGCVVVSAIVNAVEAPTVTLAVAEHRLASLTVTL